MKSRLFTLLSVLCALCVSLPAQTTSEPASPAPYSAAWFQQYHDDHVADFREENATLSQSSAERNVVLLGDSLTEGWNNADRIARFLPGRRVVNRGISADTVGRGRGIVSRLQESVFDCNPSHVFLLAAVNDIADHLRDGAPPMEEVRATYREIVDSIRRERPDVTLAVTTLTPTTGGHGHLMPLIQEFNTWLRRFAAENGLVLLDLAAAVADENGLLPASATGDGLHFHDPVYRIWGVEIERILEATDAPEFIPPDLAAWFEHGQERIVQFRRENVALQVVSPEETHVILLGSSTMEGWKNGSRVARFLPPEFDYLNRGIGADRIGVGETGILHRLSESVFDTNPSHVIIQNGTNDLFGTARRGSPTIESVAATYRAVIASIESECPGVPIAIATCQPLRNDYAVANEETLEFNENLLAIAEEFDCTLIDLHGLLVDDEGLMREDLTRDGLHFNDEGYRMFGEAIGDFLRN